MPPKGNKKPPAKDANLKEKIKKKRSTKHVEYPAQLISELNVKRGRVIATALGIKNSSKFSFPTELVPLIKEKMMLVTDCPTCDGQCVPETHRFPAVGPPAPTEEQEEVESGSANSSDDSHVSQDDSPPRSTFRALEGLDNPLDNVVPESIPQQPFVEHIRGLPPLDDPQAGHSRILSPPARSRSKSPPEDSSAVVLSDSSSEEEEEVADTEIEEAKKRQDREIAAATKILQQKQAAAKELAAKKKRKQDRAAARAAKASAGKKILAEMEKKHREIMKSISDASMVDDVFEASARPSTRASVGADNPVRGEPTKQSRSSRNNSGGSESSRSRNKSRVSFEDTRVSPPSHRTESERPAREFHPEYRDSSARSRSASSTSEMSLMMDMLERQQKSSELMAKAIDKLASSGSRSVPISDVEGFEDARGSVSSSRNSVKSSGHLQVVQDGNSAMARALGVNPGLKFAFTGDMENIDVSKLRKNMVSGKHRKNAGIVVKQHVWPHDVVSRASAHLWPDTVKDFEFGHWDQTFANFQEGFCQKILVDHEDELSPVIMNKLRVQSYLIRQAYVLSWADILSISEQFFEAYEYNVVDWTCWSDIEKFLKDACEQARMSALARPNHTPAAGAAPSGQPAKKDNKFEGNIKGVPWRYMKKVGICCGFNSGSCQQSGDHKIKDEDVVHWCGGCYAASKGVTKSAHRAKDCGKGPWKDKSLFA